MPSSADDSNSSSSLKSKASSAPAYAVVPRMLLWAGGATCAFGGGISGSLLGGADVFALMGLSEGSGDSLSRPRPPPIPPPPPPKGPN